MVHLKPIPGAWTRLIIDLHSISSKMTLEGMSEVPYDDYRIFVLKVKPEVAPSESVYVGDRFLLDEVVSASVVDGGTGKSPFPALITSCPRYSFHDIARVAASHLSARLLVVLANKVVGSGITIGYFISLAFPLQYLNEEMLVGAEDFDLIADSA